MCAVTYVKLAVAGEGAERLRTEKLTTRTALSVRVCVCVTPFS